jgi:hypothetical protein
MWWNSISGSTISPTDWPASSTLARLFVDPENTMVI